MNTHSTGLSGLFGLFFGVWSPVARRFLALAASAGVTVIAGCSQPAGPASAPAAAPPATSAPTSTTAPTPTPTANTLTCDGPFTPNTTEAELRQRFGDANVTAGRIYAAEGMSVPGLLVYGADPARRLEIIQSANAPHRILSVGAGSTWSGPSGLRVGSSLADVERANGRPFAVSGFSWDYGGWVLDWRGGAFAAADDAPCRLSLRLAPAENASSDQALGEGSFASDSAGVLSQRPVVSEWSIDFNVPGAVQPEPTMPN